MVIKKNLALFVMISATLVGNNLHAMKRIEKSLHVIGEIVLSFSIVGTCVAITQTINKSNTNVQDPMHIAWQAYRDSTNNNLSSDNWARTQALLELARQKSKK